jgi:ABC-type lipoprotein export system ATPase subunit
MAQAEWSVDLRGIDKEFQNGEILTKVLHGISLQVASGEFLAIMGPSGSGKSTLMHIMGFLDRPTRGQYLFFGRDASGLADDELARMRRDEVGFVFQFFYLLPNSRVIDNVMLPMVYQRIPYQKRRHEAKRVLKQVGLEHRFEHLSNQLSGGERQRVAVARALVGDPSIIFADEPTGNLDSKNGEAILLLLQELNEQGKTVIMVTHENEAAAYAGRVIKLRDGRIVSDEKNRSRKRGGFNK